MKTNTLVFVILIIWFFIALLAGLSGVLYKLTPPTPQVVIFGQVLLLIVLFNLSKSLRLWMQSINLKYLIAVHISRLVGIYFLYLYSLRLLPYDFAVKGGVGDIIVAVSALILVICNFDNRKLNERIYLAWNTIGMLDIIFVVLTAARLSIDDRQSMTELFRLPLSILPTFLVPIIIFTHIIIYTRLFRGKPDIYTFGSR